MVPIYQVLVLSFIQTLMKQFTVKINCFREMIVSMQKIVEVLSFEKLELRV